MITWTCNVCKRPRPDDKIGVVSRAGRMGSLLGKPLIAKATVRYCTDNPSCKRKAVELAKKRLAAMVAR